MFNMCYAGGLPLSNSDLSRSWRYESHNCDNAQLIISDQMDLNSMERVVEYLDLPQEPPTIVESHRPPAYWPSSSDSDSLVVVEDLEIRYAPELDPGKYFHLHSFTLRS